MDRIGISSAAAALALIACDAPAAAPPARQWTPVSWGGQAGDRQLWFVERASIRRQGETLELETMMVRQRPTAGGVERAEERNRIFCDRRSALSLDQRLYGAGKLLLRGEPEAEPTRFPPGSAWQILIDSVCEDDLPDLATPDPAGHARQFFAR